RPFLEGNEIGLGLAVQPNHGEGRNIEAERPVIQDRGEALDDACLLERTHPAQTRRRRDAYLAGKLDIGDAPVGLKLAQDSPVGGIEAGGTHLGCSLWTMAGSRDIRRTPR